MSLTTFTSIARACWSSVINAVAFVIYIWRQYDLFQHDTERGWTSASLVLVGEGG